jgi:hypothetical protein
MLINPPTFSLQFSSPQQNFPLIIQAKKNLHRKIFPPEKISFVNSILEKFLLTFAFPIFKLKAETLPNYKAGHNKNKAQGKNNNKRGYI